MTFTAMPFLITFDSGSGLLRCEAANAEWDLMSETFTQKFAIGDPGTRTYSRPKLPKMATLEIFPLTDLMPSDS
jgi:hypothetical protein